MKAEALRGLLLICFTMLMLSGPGCGVYRWYSTPTPAPTPTATATPSPSPTPYPTLRPTLTPEPPDTGWQPLLPGVELRQMNVEDGPVTERVIIVRLDPEIARFRVHYDPVRPLPVSGWATLLEAPLVVNGGYFTPENETAGLLVSQGHTWGRPYGDFAGMFAVTADGKVSVRWLRLQPYDPNEPLQEAIQSFPVLVKPGGVMGFPADADDGRPARRTVVAQDRQGDVLFIAAPRGYLSLHKLAVFLSSSDLNLDIALNLDGGYSTGMWLETVSRSVQIDSLVPVPSVISVELPAAP